MNRVFGPVTAACAAVAAFTITCAPATAAYTIAGSLQTEQGDSADWDPTGSSLIMTEDPSGFHSQTAVNLNDGERYAFKILDDEGTPPATWDDPQVTPDDVMAYGDSDGIVLITADANKTNNVGKAVVWVESDNAPLQVVGSFQDEAGGGGDWNPADPLFAMMNDGGGYYSYAATISTPGDYEFKVTDGTGWDWQIGPDGYSRNAATFMFSTTSPDEQVIMFVDTAGRALGIVPEPTTVALTICGALAVLIVRRR